METKEDHAGGGNGTSTELGLETTTVSGEQSSATASAGTTLVELSETKQASEQPREDDSEDDDDEEEEEACKELVRLGVPGELDTVTHLHCNKYWNDWEGGIIGGTPVWLNPMTLPSEDQLSCSHCKKALVFLMQFYAPWDGSKDAFHRTMYVFWCPNQACLNKHSVKVLRCQLPKANDIYPTSGDFEGSDDDEEGSDDGKDLGLRNAATGSHAATTAELDVIGMGRKDGVPGYDTLEERQADVLSSLHYKTLDLGVKPEPAAAIAPPPSVEEQMAEWKSESGGGQGEEEGMDITDLTQHDLMDTMGALGMRQDRLQRRFFKRIEAAPRQVLRYARWKPHCVLWCCKEGSLPSDSDAVPPCPGCGSARKFEFQIMPQLLSFLDEERAESRSGNPKKKKEARRRTELSKDVDFGTIAVFTCTNSCQHSQAAPYAEEFAHVQLMT